MLLYTQAVRPLRVTTPLGPDALLLVGLSGHEAISRLFQFRLDLMAENETDVPFETLLGQKVVVELGFPDQDVRYIGGICARIGQAGRDQTFTAYHMEVVPQLWFLTRIAQSRIFQQTTVPEILAQVLKGLDVQFQLTGRYEPRDYCVQYRETDFNFASRLMEEEGIFYFFRHSSRGHTLIVADSPQSFPELSEPLIFDEEFTGGNRDEERIGSWEKVQELRSGKVTLWDHSFELPGKHLEADKIMQDSVAVGQVTHKLKINGSEKLELYDYPGEYAQRFDGVNPGGGDRPADVQKIFTDNKRTVELRMQEEAAAGLIVRGSGNVRALVSGSKFELTGHFGADGSYLLTGVEHSARLPVSYRSGDPDPYHYASSFTCLPAALPFRPQRATPRPFVQGTQTAVVVGPPGEEIFTDKYGRVKVQFHWDRQGKLEANSSCWVRVGTIWAGKQWGAIHIPRIGQEVIVAFEEGDPDQPIIVGSVYNAEQMPPFGLPGGKVVSGIKSQTHKGAGYNEMTFDDTAGQEKVTIHGQYDMNTTVEHDQTTTVHNNRTDKIDVDDSLTVGNNQTISIGVNRTEQVGANHSESIGSNMTISVASCLTETVGINYAETVGAAMELTVGAIMTQSIGAAYLLDVGAYMNESIGASKNVGIGSHYNVKVGSNFSEKVGGKHSETVGGAYALDAQSILLDAKSSITLKTGSASITLKSSGQIVIKGVNITIKGSGKVVEKATTITSEASAKHTVKGAMVSAEASGIHSIKGALVKIN